MDEAKGNVKQYLWNVVLIGGVGVEVGLQRQLTDCVGVNLFN